MFLIGKISWRFSILPASLTNRYWLTSASMLLLSHLSKFRLNIRDRGTKIYFRVHNLMSSSRKLLPSKILFWNVLLRDGLTQFIWNQYSMTKFLAHKSWQSTKFLIRSTKCSDKISWTILMQVLKSNKFTTTWKNIRLVTRRPSRNLWMHCYFWIAIRICLISIKNRKCSKHWTPINSKSQPT